MGKALYRKYRSKSLKEIVGQEHITQTLEQALKQGRISHAYLFTGPRGVGKTSIARILAHEINNLPYEDDSTHIDIIEIDAASNRRIDEIRELRDKVNVAPTSAKYKVYIIDEVHMLTREAFNALLKTLEEPPAHVVFILATTDAHKLPETIVSRTQRFTFKPVEKPKVVEHLKSIAKEEGIKVSPEALELLAEHGEGSFRDSISLLDQASSKGESLELIDVQQLLGIPPTQSVQELLDLIADGGNSSSAMTTLNSLFEQGYQAASIAKQLGQLLRLQLADNDLKLPYDQTLELLSQLIAVPPAHDPERFLEITLLKFIAPSPVSKPKPVTTTSLEEVITEEIQEIQPDLPPEPEEQKPEPKQPKATGTASMDEAIWPEVLAVLKQRHNTLYGVVRMAQPTFSDKGLTLAFAFAFHEKRIKENANRQKIADIIYELTGKAASIECLLDKAAKPLKVAVPAPETKPSSSLSAISNIFGGAELLES